MRCRACGQHGMRARPTRMPIWRGGFLPKAGLSTLATRTLNGNGEESHVWCISRTRVRSPIGSLACKEILQSLNLQLFQTHGWFQAFLSTFVAMARFRVYKRGACRNWAKPVSWCDRLVLNQFVVNVQTDRWVTHRSEGFFPRRLKISVTSSVCELISNPTTNPNSYVMTLLKLIMRLWITFCWNNQLILCAEPWQGIRIWQVLSLRRSVDSLSIYCKPLSGPLIYFSFFQA